MDDIVERLRAEGADAFHQKYSLGMYKLCAEAADEIERLRAAQQPSSPVTDDSPVEVWHGGRKVTVYNDVVVRCWGTNIDDEMSDEPRTHESVGAAFDWLFNAPAQSPLTKRPVAWRCKDYADGWIIFQDEAAAYKYHTETDCMMQGMYVRDASPVTSTDSAPGHTDLMVSPESIDEFMEANPLPADTRPDGGTTP